MRRLTIDGLAFALILGGLFFSSSIPAWAQAGPTMLDPNLQVNTVASGLSLPVAMAFLGPHDILVTEKNTGKVKRIVNGAVHSTVLDLNVNFGSERGLLGIALHPDFPENPGVYLYNSESTTGADTDALAATPLLGNRVDRFVWNGSTLTFDRNIIRLRAFQNDKNMVNLNNPQEPPQPLLRGNHNGGVLRFGPDSKLYLVIGDEGRRGWLQNNLLGPDPDDEFGGPEPDNAHMSGVILRLNDDGTTPTDNPFFNAGANMGGEVGSNIQKLYAYGVRNSFGMAFDPKSGALWISENAGRAFDEINRIDPGHNGGWVQIMGPVARIEDYKAIEVGVGIGPTGPVGLQQLRWPATNIADSPAEALSRLFVLPGSHYSDPEFSWKHVVPPGGIGFVNGSQLGPQYEGDLIVGSAVSRPTPAPPSVMANPGHLYRFQLTGNRKQLDFDDPLLEDKVADNTGRDDFVTEGSEILFGRDFGIVTDIQTGPDGQLYLVSLSRGEIVKISQTSVTGSAKRLGEAGAGNVGMLVKFEFAGAIDLSTSTITIHSLLDEAGGAGELVAELPVTLEALPGGRPNGAIFETPPQARPKFRVEVQTKGDEGLFSFLSRVEFATIAFPLLCPPGSRPPRTNLATHFTIDDGVNPPVVVALTHAWRCLDFIRGTNNPRSLAVP